MSAIRKSEWWSAAGELAAAVILLSVVFFAPDGGDSRHQPFLAGAFHSGWTKLFEWPAAWCSLKIILFGLTIYFILDASSKIWINRRNTMSGLFFLVWSLALIMVFGL